MTRRWILSLREVLDAVDDFGTASLELVAWEYSLAPLRVEQLWNDAITQGLLAAGDPDQFGEQMYALTPTGRARLAALRAMHVDRETPESAQIRMEGGGEA